MNLNRSKITPNESDNKPYNGEILLWDLKGPDS